MPILSDMDFEKLRGILDLPATENNTDDVYNVKQWCKMLIVKVERKNELINEQAHRLYEVQKTNANLIREKQTLEELIK